MIEKSGKVVLKGSHEREKTLEPTPAFLPGESHGQRQETVHGITKSWTWLSY